MEQELSYETYRRHIEETSYKKKKLQGIINKKRQYYQEYLAAHRKYREMMAMQDKLTKEILDMIP